MMASPTLHRSSPAASLVAAMFRPRASRQGFTMVEILVVIVIIAMLAGLTAAVAFPAIRRARETRIKVEIGMLDGAIKAYKQKHNAYPPSNMSTEAEVKRHLNKAHPQNVETSNATLWADIWSKIGGMSPAQSMVFWLSGVSKDPEYPLTGTGGPLHTEPDMEPYFEFDKSRLVYFPVGSTGYEAAVYKPKDSEAPYAYFRSTNYLYGNSASTYQPWTYDSNAYHSQSWGTARPYPTAVAATVSSPKSVEWANEDSFQIISAGLDGDYGVGGVYPTGAGYTFTPYTSTGYATDPTGDLDNITNFSERNLGDARPE